MDGAARRFDLVTIGGITWDVIGRPEDATVLDHGGRRMLAVPHGGKVHLDDATFAYGGGAANVAVVASRLGLRVAVVARVGEDAAGDGALSHLADEGVDVSTVSRDAAARTGTSLVLTAPDGDRTVLVHAGANAHLGRHELLPELVGATRWLHVTSLRGEADRLFDELGRRATEAGTLLSLNPGTTQVRRGSPGLHAALEACDLLVVNDDEARILLGAAPSVAPERLVGELHGKVRGLAVVTCGAAGSVACGPDGVVHRQPALAGAVVCTLGAGDAFAGAVLAGLAHGLDAHAALALGARDAAAVLARPGAHAGALLGAPGAELSPEARNGRPPPSPLHDRGAPAPAGRSVRP